MLFLRNTLRIPLSEFQSRRRKPCYEIISNFSSCLITGAVPLIAAPVASAVNMPSVLNVQPSLTTNQVPVPDSKQTKPKTTKQRKRPPKPPSQAATQKKMQLLQQQHQQQQQQQQQQQYLPTQQPTMMFAQSTQQQQQQQQQQPFFPQVPQQRGLQPGLQSQAQQR